MTTTEDPSTAVDTDGGIVVIPAVTVPASFPDEVAETRRQLEGLTALAERVYVNLLPQARKVDDAADLVHEKFGNMTGWSELVAEMMDVAGAFLVATGQHEGDIGWWPHFITDDDRRRREERTAKRMLKSVEPAEVSKTRELAQHLVDHTQHGPVAG